MHATFLTPFAAAFALTALVPLAVLYGRVRRLRAMRSALGLGEPARASWLPLVLALAAIPALLGIAASQPVVETTQVRPERTDAQAFFVFDVSRSMLASTAAGRPTRFERARDVALSLRNQLPELPIGIASLTDGVLPHLFPTTDRTVFETTLEKAVGVGKTPTAGFYLTLATNLNSLSSLAQLNYFPASAKKRVVVVFTDGESQPLVGGSAAALSRQRIQPIFVRFWAPDERIYETGVPEGGYEPDPRSEVLLGRFATAMSARVFSEDQAAEVADAIRQAIGKGEIVDRAHEERRLALMPYIVLLSFVPLSFVLLRRNVWWARIPNVRRRVDRAPEGAKVSEQRGVAQPG